NSTHCAALGGETYAAKTWVNGEWTQRRSSPSPRKSSLRDFRALAEGRLQNPSSALHQPRRALSRRKVANWRVYWYTEPVNEVSHTAGQGLSDGKPPEVKRLVAGLSQAVAATPGVRAAFLFGSCWEGSTWAESDVDLAVMFEPGLDSSMRLAAEKRLLEQAEKVLGAVGERL